MKKYLFFAVLLLLGTAVTVKGQSTVYQVEKVSVSLTDDTNESEWVEVDYLCIVNFDDRIIKLTNAADSRWYIVKGTIKHEKTLDDDGDIQSKTSCYAVNSKGEDFLVTILKPDNHPNYAGMIIIGDRLCYAFLMAEKR